MTMPPVMDPNAIAQGFGQGNMPTAQGPKLSLWDRLQNAIAPRPEALGGLLSQEDHKAARNQGLLAAGLGMLEQSGWSSEPRTLGQIVARGAQQGVGAYQGAVANTAQQALGKQQYDANRLKMTGLKSDMARVQKVDAARQQIIGELGRPPQGDPEAMRAWLERAIPAFVGAGDDQTVTSLTEAYKSLGSQQQRGRNTYEVDRGDKIELRDSRTNAVLETIPKGIAPRDVAMGAEARQEMSEQRRFQRGNMLGDDYRATTASIAKAADQYRTLTAAADGAREGIPASQIALVFSFMKTLDPTSVVRESEYATAENARGVPESVRNMWNKVKDGSRLTPVQVDQMVNEAGASARAWKQQQDHHIKSFAARAGRWGVDPNDVTLDYFEGLPMGAKPQTPAAPGSVPRFNMDHVFPNRRQ
jgi:hypothetical protein